jgi:hypothetical protein
MPIKPLLTALLVAILLGVVTLGVVLVPRWMSGAAEQAFILPGDRLVDMDIGQVQEIVIGDANGTYRCVRSADLASWTLAFGAGGAASAVPSEGGGMELDAELVRVSLRRLFETRASGSPTAEALRSVTETAERQNAKLKGALGQQNSAVPIFGERTLSVRLRTSAGATRVLHLSPTTLGGQSLVMVTSPGQSGGAGEGSMQWRLAVVSENLHAEMSDRGPMSWRLRTPWTRLATRLSSVRVVGESGTSVVLSRTGAAWSVSEPVRVPANPESISALLSSLANVRIATFIDDDTARAEAENSLASPRARVSGQGDGATLELLIGRAADPAARTVFARLDQRPVATIDAESLTRIAAEPTSYISPLISHAEQADIHGLTIAGGGDGRALLSLSRSAAGWDEVRESDQRIAQGEERAREVQLLLNFLTRAPAMSIRITPPEPAPTLIGTIDVSDAKGQKLQTARVLRVDPAMIWVEVDGVFRGYSTLPGLLQRLLGSPMLNVGQPAAPIAPSEPQK